MKNVMFILAFGIFSFIVSCKNKETSTTTADTATTTAAVDTAAADYTVDTTATVLNWTGSKPTGKHTGTIKVNNGKVSVKGGQVVGGEVTLNMNSINVTDLKGGEKAGLEGHLKGAKKGEEDHFFNVAKFPTAKFAITNVTGVTNDSTATHLIYGNLTIKDITKQVSFKAKVDSKDGMVNINTQPFNINRTDYNIKFGSKTFFSDLKDKFIDDNVSVAFNLSAKK